MATTKFRGKEREAAEAKARALKKKRRKKKTVTALVITLLTAVLVVCVLSITVFLKTENIVVKGNNTYSAEEILSAAEINKGDNLLLISSEKINRKLPVLLPFVDSVKVEKNLPGTLKLTVTETKEEVCFVNKNNCFSADLKGKILKEYEKPDENLIKITISDGAKLLTGTNIEFSNERETTLFNNYLNLIKELEYKINFINISDQFSSYMKIDDRIIVKLGSSSYFAEKVAYLKASLAGINSAAEGVFDLSAWTPENNQPVLTYGDISAYEK